MKKNILLTLKTNIRSSFGLLNKKIYFTLTLLNNIYTTSASQMLLYLVHKIYIQMQP